MILFSDVNSSKDSARLATNISSIGWCSVSAFALFFFLALTKKITAEDSLLKKSVTYLVIFSPAALFLYKQWTGFIIVDFVKEYYGWSHIWSDSTTLYLFYIYNFLFLFISQYLCIDFMRKTKSRREKKQMKIMLTTGMLTIILGSISNIVLQELHFHKLPGLANVSGLIWSLGLVYAVTRHGLMTITPQIAADSILKTMGDSLILIDPDSNIMVVNQSTLDLLGYREKELVGKPITTIFDQGEYSDRLSELVQKASIKDYNGVYRARSGGEIPISLFMSLLKDEEGELVGIVCIAKDMRQIRHFMQKEKELAAIVIESERRRVAELEKAYAELRNTQSQLIQSVKMAAVGQIGAGVAHELNNPLAGISGFAQFTLEKFRKAELSAEDFKSCQKYLERIEQESGRCKKIVENLLKFSRRPITLKPTPLDIAQVLDDTLSIIGHQLKLSNVNVIMDIKPGVAQVRGIANQLQQVFANIILNAQEAMPNGGELRIVVDNIIDEEIKTLHEVKIEFKDIGYGISEENLPHIFEPFFTTKQKEKGTGLGLAVSYQIIQEHKGTIEAISQLGKGTIVRITLPAIVNK